MSSNSVLMKEVALSQKEDKCKEVEATQVSPSFSFISSLTVFLAILISMIIFTIWKRELLNVYFKIKKGKCFPDHFLGEGFKKYIYISITKHAISEKVLGTGNAFGQSVTGPVSALWWP